MSQKQPLQYVREQLRQLIWNLSQRDFVLTRPHAAIVSLEGRRRVRLFLSMLIGYIACIVAMVFIRVLFDSNYTLTRDPLIISLFVAVIGFTLGRSEHYNNGSLLVIASILGLTIGAFLQSPDMGDLFYAIMLLSINGMLASMLLSTFRTGLVIALNMLGLGLLAIVSPLNIGDVGPSVAIFLILNGFIVAKKLLSQRDLQQIIDQSHDLVMSQRRFETVVENLHEGLLITDLDDKVLYANTYMTALTGYTRHEFLGRKSFDLLGLPEYREEMVSRNKERARGKAERYEIQQRRRDGTSFLAEISGIPYFDLDGIVIGTIGVITDITERREIEQQRLEMNVQQEKTQLLRDLIGALSHDLKTPLAVINTNLYLLEQATDTTAREDRVLILKKQTERLERLIESILTSYRLDSSPRPLFGEVDVNSLLNGCLERFEAVAISKNIQLDANLDQTYPRIRGDEFSLTRVFDNLLENACNYTSPKGTVSVRSELNEHFLMVRISDTGIGIGDEDIPRIFDRFFRADAARNSMRGGTGLGLSIVKQIVEMHHGSIEVESVEGQGTTFVVKLSIEANPQ
jgi:PAS domain S-box-containing protein